MNGIKIYNFLKDNSLYVKLNYDKSYDKKFKIGVLLPYNLFDQFRELLNGVLDVVHFNVFLESDGMWYDNFNEMIEWLGDDIKDYKDIINNYEEEMIHYYRQVKIKDKEDLLKAVKQEFINKKEHILNIELDLREYGVQTILNQNNINTIQQSKKFKWYFPKYNCSIVFLFSEVKDHYVVVKDIL